MAFAITGVLAAAPETQSIVALIVLGVISAVGGGTIRDLVLGTRVFWIRDFTFIWLAVAGSLAGVTLVLLGRKGMQSKIPYGPYLAFAAAVWIFWGPTLWDAYLRLILERAHKTSTTLEGILSQRGVPHWGLNE